MLSSILLFWMCGVVVGLAAEAKRSRSVYVGDIIFALSFSWLAYLILCILWLNENATKVVWREPIPHPRDV